VEEGDHLSSVASCRLPVRAGSRHTTVPGVESKAFPCSQRA
jgi:hypothetical protein